jgi:hypothetical protein
MSRGAALETGERKHAAIVKRNRMIRRPFVRMFDSFT